MGGDPGRDNAGIRINQAEREVKLKSLSIQIARLLEGYDRRERVVIVTEAKRLLGCTDKDSFDQEVKEHG